MENESEINRLISAALVSERFRALLLDDPRKAIETGYNDETFNLDPQVVEAISSIRATSLDAFVREVISRCKMSVNWNGQST
jgi:hypothetical protein